MSTRYNISANLEYFGSSYTYINQCINNHVRYKCDPILPGLELRKRSKNPARYWFVLVVPALIASLAVWNLMNFQILRNDDTALHSTQWWRKICVNFHGGTCTTIVSLRYDMTKKQPQNHATRWFWLDYVDKRKKRVTHAKDDMSQAHEQCPWSLIDSLTMPSVAISCRLSFSVLFSGRLIGATKLLSCV